jgi:DNA polymerase III alpha subunit (gram-positive type)
MTLNLTQKSVKRFRRKTIKSGGAKTKSMFSISAKEFIPSVSSSAAKPKSPNVITNLSTNFSKISMSNKNNYNYMTKLAIESLKIKTIIENSVGLDCEMVGVGAIRADGSRKSSLARVAICDFNGKRLYDKYVIPKEGLEGISDYRTEFSGITPEKLVRLDKDNHSFKKVRAEVIKIIADKIIVGHGLKNDFTVLNLDIPPNRKWDSTEIDIFMKNHPYLKRAPRRLQEIAKEYAGNEIQMADKTGHSPLEDARAAMNLYRIFYSYPKINYKNMSK